MPATLSRRLLILLGLAAAIALTRTSHFGTSEILPDASLAAFLLGGLLLQRSCGFGVMLAVAFGADVISAQTATEAGWCITPAYFGLIPTYGVLWLTGRWLGSRFQQSGKFDFVHAAVASLAAIALAFVISNATWYAFSGTVAGMGIPEFTLAVAKYFPPYLGSAMLYLIPVWLGWKLTHAGRISRI
jgi:hypothetical protein